MFYYDSIIYQGVLLVQYIDTCYVMVRTYEEAPERKD